MAALCPDNEPELDQKYGCALPAAWLDHLRIRSAALRAVFADMNADTRAGRKLTIIAAPFSMASNYKNSLGQLSVKVLCTKTQQRNQALVPGKQHGEPTTSLENDICALALWNMYMAPALV